MAVAQLKRSVGLTLRAFFAAAFFGAFAGVLTAASPVRAQEGVALPSGAGVPGFWDPRRRPERPDLSRLQSIRFLTELDYPPFNYAGADGNPVGFNVDLARQLFDEIKITCRILTRIYMA